MSKRKRAIKKLFDRLVSLMRKERNRDFATTVAVVLASDMQSPEEARVCGLYVAATLIAAYHQHYGTEPAPRNGETLQ